MKTNTLFRIGTVAAIILAIGIAFSWLTFTRIANASAPSGLPAAVSAVSTTTVSTTAIQLAATSTCAARIVSTGGASAVMLGFSAFQGTTTTGTTGIYQAASTTVAYDSGIYGCGQLSAYSYASSLVNVVTTQ